MTKRLIDNGWFAALIMVSVVILLFTAAGFAMWATGGVMVP